VRKCNNSVSGAQEIYHQKIKKKVNNKIITEHAENSNARQNSNIEQ
jgi:hypothetical protein